MPLPDDYPVEDLPAAFAYAAWTMAALALSVPVWRWMGLL
jgi:hypothetical protein